MIPNLPLQINWVVLSCKQGDDLGIHLPEQLQLLAFLAALIYL